MDSSAKLNHCEQKSTDKFSFCRFKLEFSDPAIQKAFVVDHFIRNKHRILMATCVIIANTLRYAVT